MGTRKKSGQAAMEFLMTYGWAILVVLIAVGAMAYFGVFNVSSLMPQRCMVPAPFSCQGFLAKATGAAATDDVTFQVTLMNGGVGAVTITEVLIDDVALRNQLGACTSGPLSVVLNPGAQNSFSVTCDDKASLNGQRLRTAIKLKYTDSATGYDHTAAGEIIADIEAA